MEGYLEELKLEKVKTTTWRTKKDYLTPWVKWLWKNGLQPTSQRIKQFLTRKRKHVESYRTMGKVIVDFTNHWSERCNEVKLIKAHGQLPEKDTLTMPQEALESLQAHVKLRTEVWGSQAEKLATQDHAMTLAKDLGKYSLPRPHNTSLASGAVVEAATSSLV